MLSNLYNAGKRRPSRRKSCVECIQAKRRCDPRQLACSRCNKQMLECRYLPYSTTNRVNNQPQNPVSASTREVISTTGTRNGPIDTIEWPLGLLGTPSNEYLGSASLVPAAVDEFSISNFDLRAFDQLSSPTLLSLPLPETANLTDLPLFPASRLNFGINELKMAPSRMVLENQTPWSHPLLYEERMPRSMEDALAACSFYLAKNDTNSRFVFRHIELRVAELLASPNPSTPLEILARAQTLILYQIMRVFDGDILARAQAEKAIPHLESYALSVKSLLDEGEDEFTPSSLHIYPTGPAKATWKSYIFRESARRTFLICFFFLSLYHALKGNVPYCRDHPELPSIWTASAHLWNASSVFDFAIAWKEKKHFVVRNLDHEVLLAEGEANDVDTFGRIIVVANLGIDDARGWFYSRGGCL